MSVTCGQAIGVERKGAVFYPIPAARSALKALMPKHR